MASPALLKIYDLGLGTYDVSVSVGPSYQSRRQEAIAALLDFMKAIPSAAPFIGDLVAANSDWPQARELAERLRKMLPPQLQDAEDQDPAQQLQQAQVQFHALAQQHTATVQQLQQAIEIIRTKQQEQVGKLAIAQLQEETKLAIAEVTTKAQDAKRRAELELDIWKQLHSSAHEVAMEAMGNANQPASPDQGQQPDIQQAQPQV